MAILRGGRRVFGTDIRIGIPRDRSLDNVQGDPRLKRTMGNPESTIGRFQSKMAEGEGFARPNRFIKGDRIDAAISELEFSKRKVSLSIKLLEELQNKEAVSKFSSPLSGKNLPFSSLSDKLEKKEKK